MLRKALEDKNIHLSDSEFTVVMQITTDNIKLNRIGFKKRTSLEEAINIAIKSVMTLGRC